MVSKTDEKIDVLKFTDIRRTIRDIIDSYHHPWDYLSELVQNAYGSCVEARKSNVGKPPWNILVLLNQQEEFCEVVDTGTGVKKEDIPKVLAPGVSFTKPYLPGEKGLGLTFVVFSSSKFEIESCFNGDINAARYDGAFSWVSDVTGTVPASSLTWIDPRGHDTSRNYTRIRVEGDRFEIDYTPDRLENILRTKTAVGNVLALFDAKITKVFMLLFTT